MTNVDFTNLPRRTASGKVFREKHLILLNTQNIMDMMDIMWTCFIAL